VKRSTPRHSAAGPRRESSSSRPHGRRCSPRAAALLLNVDPVRLVRGKTRGEALLLSKSVNDRPYVASSLLSAAIAQVFALGLARAMRGPREEDRRL